MGGKYILGKHLKYLGTSCTGDIQVLIVNRKLLAGKSDAMEHGRIEYNTIRSTVTNMSMVPNAIRETCGIEQALK